MQTTDTHTHTRDTCTSTSYLATRLGETRRAKREAARLGQLTSMDTIQSSAALFVVPTPSPHSLSPLDASSTRYTSLSGSSSGDLQAGFLVLVPVALVVFIVVALLGAYKWQQGRESSEGSLCQSWRRRIYRRTSSPRHPVAVRGRITTTQGN